MRQDRRFPINYAKPDPEPRPEPEPAPEPAPSALAGIKERLFGFRRRYQSFLLLGSGVVIALAAVFAFQATRPPAQRLTQRDIDAAVSRTLASATPKPSFASQAYQVIRPSVVRIEALLSEQGGKPEGSVGAGIAIDDKGTILTSLHVVRDAAGIRVIFADGSDSEAEIVGAEPSQDLAVLAVAVVPDDLLPATLDVSEVLRVGDEVVAVGNPFGITGSASAGVVSGLGRSFKSPRTGETLTDLIQFDAAVNPGNSGGPLVNRKGEVVGIVTALLNPTEQDVFIGIGFAVPIATAAGAAGAAPPF